MPQESSGQDLLFEVLTPLGFRVRVTRSFWELIVTIRHPAMAGREADVQDTLVHPEEIRRSSRDPDVQLFYRVQRMGRWVCAVSRRLDEEEGFMITAYPTNGIKEGVRIWPR